MMPNSDERQELVSVLVSSMLTSFGEDTSREGLAETPRRVARMYEELLSGYTQDLGTMVKTFDSNGYSGLVTVTNISFYSLCEHHMIPFYGKVHVGYIPNGKVLGLSKFARLVEAISRRLQTQENITQQLAQVLETNLKPKVLVVHLEATHLCMSMRGIKKTECITRTTAQRGSFEDNPSLMEQFYREIYAGRKTDER